VLAGMPGLGSIAHGLRASLQATFGASLQLMLAAGLVVLLGKAATAVPSSRVRSGVALVIASIGLLAGGLFRRHQEDDELMVMALLDDSRPRVCDATQDGEP